jgi:hypothetical protein
VAGNQILALPDNGPRILRTEGEGTPTIGAPAAGLQQPGQGVGLGVLRHVASSCTSPILAEAGLTAVL